MKDSRYSINLEFCGYSKARYVVRFCGDYIGHAKSKNSAEAIANKHKELRNIAVSF